MASEPYWDDAPSRSTSMLAIATEGIVATSGQGLDCQILAAAALNDGGVYHSLELECTVGEGRAY